jgi:hypothetical protein
MSNELKVAPKAHHALIAFDSLLSTDEEVSMQDISTPVAALKKAMEAATAAEKKAADDLAAAQADVDRLRFAIESLTGPAPVRVDLGVIPRPTTPARGPGAQKEAAKGGGGEAAMGKRGSSSGASSTGGTGPGKRPEGENRKQGTGPGRGRRVMSCAMCGPVTVGNKTQKCPDCGHLLRAAKL